MVPQRQSEGSAGAGGTVEGGGRGRSRRGVYIAGAGGTVEGGWSRPGGRAGAKGGAARRAAQRHALGRGRGVEERAFSPRYKLVRQVLRGHVLERVTHCAQLLRRALCLLLPLSLAILSTARGGLRPTGASKPGRPARYAATRGRGPLPVPRPWLQNGTGLVLVHSALSACSIDSQSWRCLGVALMMATPWPGTAAV